MFFVTNLPHAALDENSGIYCNSTKQAHLVLPSYYAAGVRPAY